MSEYVGDYTAGATVQHKWTTKDVDRAPIAPSSAFDSGDIRIYKGSSATQRTSANGINVTSPFDSLVGVHHIAIDLSDNTDAGFYAAGNDYQVVLVTAKTVDGYSVDNTVLLEFSIGNRDGTVTSLNSNVITTASINDGALTAAKLATGVITNAKFAAGAIDAAAIADNAIDAGTIASDAITSAKVAAMPQQGLTGRRRLRARGGSLYEDVSMVICTLGGGSRRSEVGKRRVLQVHPRLA